MDFFENFLLNNVKTKTVDKRFKNFRSEKDIVKFILFNDELNKEEIFIDRNSAKYLLDILNGKKIDDHILYFNKIDNLKTFKIFFIDKDENKCYEEFILSLLTKINTQYKISCLPLFIQFKGKQNVLSFMGFEYNQLIIKLKYSILKQCQSFLIKDKK